MEADTVKVYSHNDPNAKPILEKVSKYTQQAEAMNLPYWVFAENSAPIGIVGVGKEPVQLLASPGTPMAIMRLIDTTQPKENIENFALEALKLAVQKNIEYALATFPVKEETAINQFKKANFQEFDDCYRMICQLDKDFELHSELEFKQVQKDEMRQFIKIAENFLQGSPDITLSKALEHLLELPDEFLNFYYSQEKFYFANKDQKTVGLINFNPSKGLISNVGVDPKQRRKGYGKQIVQFALEQLRNSNCKQAHLRVHVENKAAIHIYESLGFVKAERYKTLIWRRKESVS